MKKLALAIVVLVAAGALWRMRAHDAGQPKLLFDRFWVDHEPQGPREAFRVVFVNGEAPFGHFANRTMWTGQWEGFHYHVVPREDGVLDMLFGATNERQRVRYVARRCNDNGFDFCLDVSGTSRGVKRYFSKKEWEAHSDADVEAIAHQLAR
ncbi:MAG TPA: hypothetical protein VGL86_32665 [Polyangia bacterium]|jgi:hypothetical protein